MAIDGYLSVDAHPYLPGTHVTRFPPLEWADASVADIYCGHCLEHMPPWDVLHVLDECRRVLRPGGSLTVVTPDADKARLLAESARLTIGQYALAVHGASYDDMPHWCLWTPARLAEALTRAGFFVDSDYRWKDDARVYDRRVIYQCGVRGIKVEARRGT